MAMADIIAMFSFVKMGTGMYLELQFISSVDNRMFHGVDGTQPRPSRHGSLVYPKAISVIRIIMFLLNKPGSRWHFGKLRVELNYLSVLC